MLLQILLISAAMFYVVIGSCLFSQWLDIMERDAQINSHILLSRILLVTATILWPIVVPFAYLELLPSQSKKDIKTLAEQIHESFAAESESA